MTTRILRTPSNQPGWRRAVVAAAALAALSAPLAGCGVNRTKIEAENSSDSRLRHPIALVEQAYTVDLFPTSAVRLDERSRQQVESFATRYRQLGGGPITILVPQGGPRGGVAPYAIDSIRRELAHGGASAPVTVGHYPIENPALVAPVRLSFDGVKAKVAHACGEWPSDLASASSTEGWDNKTYWNFGCANQNMIASQVADPRDVAEPRGETPADTSMRMRAISNVRKGADPATNWTTKNSSIGSVGG